MVIEYLFVDDFAVVSGRRRVESWRSVVVVAMHWTSRNAVSKVSHVFLIITLELFESFTLFFQLIYVNTTVWSLVSATGLHFSWISRSIFALSALSTLSQWLILHGKWLLLHSIF